MAFVNRVLRGMFGAKRDGVTGGGENYTMRSLMICTAHCLTGMRKARGVYMVWWKNLRESDHLEDPVIDGRIILRWILRKWDVGVWTELSWLRVERAGGQL
jgi:hypothetical protein